MRPRLKRLRKICCARATNLPQPFQPRAHSSSDRSEEHTSELQSLTNLVCRLLLEKKKTNTHEDSNRVDKAVGLLSGKYLRFETVYMVEYELLLDSMTNVVCQHRSLSHT